MQVRKFFLSSISTLAFCWSPSIGHALQITGVSAPNLLRPSDNVLYPFNISVSGTYGQDDVILSAKNNNRVVEARYWDEDVFIFFDDPIDLTGVLTVPLIGAVLGNPWGPTNVYFQVGCDLNSKVFGPSGATREGPVMNDGYFQFTKGAGLLFTDFGSWGYNTVTCTTTPPPPPPPIPLLPLQPVPGPLPILGAYATYLWSKRLRSRIGSNRIR